MYLKISLILFFTAISLFCYSMSIFSKFSMMFFEWDLMSMNSLTFNFLILVDWKSSMFMTTVLLISSMVIFYSSEYMENEKNSKRFIYLLLLFISSMIALIMSPSMISIILGWDGLGLTSFCLVIFYENSKSEISGMITALTNRLGDVFIMMSISICLSLGLTNFSLCLKNFNLMNLIIIFMILASMTKSAQVPFSAWLPAAMAAPTPVSSLVHSSTLVTAGVYMLIRFFNKFFLESNMSFILLILSTMTIILSSISANFEFDLKKIIALSTLSQLGIMMSTISMGLPEIAMFHLIMHALFKSMLFMCAGFMIHSNLNNQDIRYFGKMYSIFPMITVFFNTGNMALCGMPFLAGFFSKDLILEMSMLSNLNMLIFFLIMLSTALTVSYTTRLIIFTMKKSNFLMKDFLFQEKLNNMQISMVILFIFSITMGKLLTNLIFFEPTNKVFINMQMKILPLLICMLGVFLGLILSLKMTSMKLLKSIFILEFFNKMWFISPISSMIFKFKLFKVSKKIFLLTSSGWIEEIVGLKLLKACFNFSKTFNFFMNLNFLIQIFFILSISIIFFLNFLN